MKKLIGYVRVSSEVSKSKGNSIINQINKVNEFCKYNDFELIDVLKDEGKSGMEYSKRDGYLELIERCKSEDIDGVVVYSLSRIGRRMKDVVDIMELFSNNNIQFYSVKENINNNDMMGKLFLFTSLILSLIFSTSNSLKLINIFINNFPIISLLLIFSLTL